MAQTRITREDVTSAVGARRELGEEMEPAVIDAFLDKVDRAIEARAAEEAGRRRGGGDDGTSFALAIISLGTGIPITAVAGGEAGLAGIIAAWLGIVGLFATGAFLQPDLAQPLTAIKMIAVLVAAMNGVAMTRLTDQLDRLPGTVRFSALPARLRLWCVWSAVVSQTAWWTAVLIGMLNTASR